MKLIYKIAFKHYIILKYFTTNDFVMNTTTDRERMLFKKIIIQQQHQYI